MYVCVLVIYMFKYGRMMMMNQRQTISSRYSGKVTKMSTRRIVCNDMTDKNVN